MAEPDPARSEASLDAIAFALAVIREDGDGQEAIMANASAEVIAGHLAILLWSVLQRMARGGDAEAFLVDMQRQLTRPPPENGPQ